MEAYLESWDIPGLYNVMFAETILYLNL